MEAGRAENWRYLDRNGRHVIFDILQNSDQKTPYGWTRAKKPPPRFSAELANTTAALVKPKNTKATIQLCKFEDTKSLTLARDDI